MTDRYQARTVARLSSTSSIYSDEDYVDAREYDPDHSISQPNSRSNNQLYDQSDSQQSYNQSNKQRVQARSAPRAADLFDDDICSDDPYEQSMKQSIRQSNKQFSNQSNNRSINQQRQPVLSPSTLDAFDPLNSVRDKKTKSSVYSFDQSSRQANKQSMNYIDDPPSYATVSPISLDDDLIAAQFQSSVRISSNRPRQTTKQSSTQPSNQSYAIALDPDVAAEAEAALAEALGQQVRHRPQSHHQSSNQQPRSRRSPDPYDQYERELPRRSGDKLTNQSSNYSKRSLEMKEHVSRAGIIQEAPINFEDESVLEQPIQSRPNISSDHSIPRSITRLDPTLRRQYSPEHLLQDELEFDRQIEARAGVRKPVTQRTVNQLHNQRFSDSDDPEPQQVTRRAISRPVSQMNDVSSKQSVDRSTQRQRRSRYRDEESASEDNDEQNSSHQPADRRLDRIRLDRPPSKQSSQSPERVSRSHSSNQSSHKSSRPKTIRVDALAFMKSGTPFLKYGSSWMAVPHFRLLSLNSDCSAIVWFSEKKSLTDSRIMLSQIDSIVEGQTTAAFAKHRAVELEGNSFSILYRTVDGKSKSLDLTAKDLNEMKIWIGGLQKMIRLMQDGRDLTQMRRCIIELQLNYGGAPSQDIIDYDSGQVVDVRNKSSVQKIIENEWDQRQEGDRTQANAQLYSELQPRFASLQDSLLKHRERLREPAYAMSSEYSVMASIVSRVERSVRQISDWMLEATQNSLELADKELWRASVDLTSLENVFKALKQ